VATVFTAGAASILMAGGSLTGAGLGGIMSAGMTAMAGGGALGAAALGSELTSLSTGIALGGAMIGGAVGSIVSQGVGIAMGMQDKFSWSAVGEGALGAGIGAGVGAALDGAGLLARATQTTPLTTMQLMQNAAVTSIATQGIKVVTGLQDHFSWTSVAAAAVGAGVGQATSNVIGGTFGSGFAGDVMRGTLSGIAGGMAARMVADGKVDFVRVGTDAFGNALGNSLAEMNWGGSQQENKALGSGVKVRSDIWGSTASYGDYAPADLSLTANGTPRLPTQMGDVSAGTQNALHLTDEDWAAIPPLTQKLPDPVQVAGLGDLKGILADAYRKGKEIVTDSAKGIGMMLNDALVRPSGSTDEIPQRRFTPTPSAAANVPRLDVGGTGQSLVAGGGSPMFTANQSPYFGTPEYQIARGLNDASPVLGFARSSMLLGSGVGALFDGNYGDAARDLSFGVVGAMGVRGAFPVSGVNSTNAASRLRYLGNETWESPLGLQYGPDAQYGNRIQHVLRHAEDQPLRVGEHGVFDVGRQGVVGIVDEAWSIAQQGGPNVTVSTVGNKSVYTVDMGRRVGWVGGQSGSSLGNPAVNNIQLVIRNGNQVITAYPIR